MQNIIYTTHSLQQSNERKQYRYQIEDVVIDTWDESDLNEKYLIASTPQEEIKQKILCYVEDWEREIIHVKNDFNARRLAYKYRGLTFYYLDEEGPNGGYAVYTINDSNNCVEWK